MNTKTIKQIGTNTMNIYTEIEGIEITKKKALKLLKDHGNYSFDELKDFIKEVGNKDIYKAKNVFMFLGY